MVLLLLNPLPQDDFHYGYEYDYSRFPAAVQPALLVNHCDDGTALFLQRCYERHRSVCAMLVDQFSLLLFKPFFSTTTVNALAFRGAPQSRASLSVCCVIIPPPPGLGRMHVLSTAQFRQHLRLADNAKVDKVLDIGAGDGHVTQQLAALATTVHVTETNPIMRLRLAMHRFEVFGRNNWQRNGPIYDVVSCLNVLDR